MDTRAENKYTTDKCNSGNNIFLQNIIKNFGDVFEQRTGALTSYKCSLHLKANGKPVYMKPRPVQYVLLNQENQELDRFI